MNKPFTVHCIPWQAGAPLFQDIRTAAGNMEIIAESEVASDALDGQCLHALALGASGNTIGCARLRRDGFIDRMVVFPRKHQAQVEAALIEALEGYTCQRGARNSRVASAKDKSHSRLRTA